MVPSHLYNASAIHAIANEPIAMTGIVNVRSDIPTSLHFRARSCGHSAGATS
jgi:hypothetical protein